MDERFADRYRELIIAAHKKTLENYCYGMSIPNEPCIVSSGDVTNRFGNMTFNPLVPQRTICPDKDVMEMVWEEFSAPNDRKYNPLNYFEII